MGHVNVIWQGDANDWALRCLAHASAPPFVVNVTGRETLAVRELAERFGELLRRAPTFTGSGGAGRAAEQRLARAFAVRPSVRLDINAARLGRRLGAVRPPLLGKPTHFEERTGAF